MSIQYLWALVGLVRYMYARREASEQNKQEINDREDGAPHIRTKQIIKQSFKQSQAKHSHARDARARRT